MICVVPHDTLGEFGSPQVWRSMAPNVWSGVCLIVVTDKGRRRRLHCQLLEVRPDFVWNVASRNALSLRVERFEFAVRPIHDTTGW